jgi:hypothetical protein
MGLFTPPLTSLMAQTTERRTQAPIGKSRFAQPTCKIKFSVLPGTFVVVTFPTGRLTGKLKYVTVFTKFSLSRGGDVWRLIVSDKQRSATRYVASSGGKLKQLSFPTGRRQESTLDDVYCATQGLFGAMPFK